jgi:hypothetical protein
MTGFCPAPRPARRRKATAAAASITFPVPKVRSRSDPASFVAISRTRTPELAAQIGQHAPSRATVGRDRARSAAPILKPARRSCRSKGSHASATISARLSPARHDLARPVHSRQAARVPLQPAVRAKPAAKPISSSARPASAPAFERQPVESSPNPIGQGAMIHYCRPEGRANRCAIQRRIIWRS